jgi:hypothetical protein
MYKWHKMVQFFVFIGQIGMERLENNKMSFSNN